MSDPVLDNLSAPNTQTQQQTAPDSIPASQTKNAGVWVDQLTADLKGLDEIKQIKEKGIPITEFVKQSLEAKKSAEEANRKLQGAIAKLGDNPTEEEVKNYQKSLLEALGVPADTSGYDFSDVQFPNRNDEVLKEMGVLFKNANVPAKMAKDFMKGYSELTKKFSENIEKTFKEKLANAEADLKKEWGKDFESKSSAVEAAIKNLPAEDADLLMKTGLLASTSFRKLIASAGKSYQESSFVNGKTQSASYGGYSSDFYQQAENAKNRR